MKKANGSHPPCDGDAPRDPSSGQRGGPTATFWPNPVTLRGYNAWTWRADSRVSSAGATGSLTNQTTWRWAQSTTQWTAKSSPSWPVQLIKVEWAKSSARGVLQTCWETLIVGETSRGGDWTREETLGGTPHGYTFSVLDPRSWREWVIGPRNRWITWNRAERPHSSLVLSSWTAEG